MPRQYARIARAAAFAGAIALVLGATPAATADEGAVIAQQQFTEVQIQAFAEAAHEVGELQREFDERAQAAENAEEIERLQQEAQMQMLQVVEASGLSPDEYNTILQAAHQDPQLYEDIVARIEALN